MYTPLFDVMADSESSGVHKQQMLIVCVVHSGCIVRSSKNVSKRPGKKKFTWLVRAVVLLRSILTLPWDAVHIPDCISLLWTRVALTISSVVAFSVCYLIMWQLSWARSGSQMSLLQAQPLMFVRPWGQLEWNPGLWVIGVMPFRYVCESRTLTLHFSPPFD